jgi:hypothetical protein
MKQNRMFSVAIYSNSSKKYERRWPECYKKEAMLVQSYGEGIPRVQKVNFSFAKLKDKEKSSQFL